MASKALKHLNDHFIVISQTKLVDTIFVSPFLIETIVKVVLAKPYFIDLLVRVINFPKIRVVLTTAFIGTARRAAPASSASAPSSPTIFGLNNSNDIEFRGAFTQSLDDLQSPSSPVLLPSKTISLDLSPTINPASPSGYVNAGQTANYMRETSLRKMDVFALVRDALESASVPIPHNNFFRYLLDDKMNEGIITRCILLINCLLGIAELTVVWGDLDEEAPGSRDSVELEGVNGIVGTNRYNAFKASIITGGVIEVLRKHVVKDNTMLTLRSALGGFQDHLLRPLGTFPSSYFPLFI